MNTPATPEAAPRRARGRPRGWHDSRAQNTIRALDRAMAVLEHLSEQGAGATLSALAGDLGESPATVYRILVTLEGREIVEFDAAAQLWHVGPRAFLIGARFLRRTSVVERARPILRALMEQTGETANLGIAREASVLFVSQVETHESIRAFFPPGTLSPMHASGIGKALLAQMAPARRARLLGAGPLARFTPFTLASPEALEADLAQALARGYALDNEERTPGMRCIAAPVFDAHGEAVAGISVSGPTSRVSEADVAGLADAVKEAARALSEAIGAVAPLSAPGPAP